MSLPVGQQDLFGNEQPAVPLTDRQAFALQHVRSSEGGLTADEMGALLHERRGKHSADVRCQWCPQEGKSVLHELRRKTPALVVRRKAGMWQATAGQATPAGGQTSEIPF